MQRCFLENLNVCEEANHVISFSFSFPSHLSMKSISAFSENHACVTQGGVGGRGILQIGYLSLDNSFDFFLCMKYWENEIINLFAAESMHLIFVS